MPRDAYYAKMPHAVIMPLMMPLAARDTHTTPASARTPARLGTSRYGVMLPPKPANQTP